MLSWYWYKFKRTVGTPAEILTLTVMFVIPLALLHGYVMNIVNLFYVTGDANTVRIVLRFIGVVVFPLGSILGYL